MQMRNRLKQALAGLLVGAGLLTGLGTAAAYAGTPDRPDVYVDGELLHFDVQPQAFQGRTLVPMRMIFESLGADVSWDAPHNTAVAVKDGLTLRLPIGSKTVTRGSQQVTLDVPAQLVGDRTMVPVRFIAEAFGNEVGWDEAQGRVTITGGANAPQVRVVGADTYGLKEGQSSHVQQLLREYNVVSTVERDSGLQFKKPVFVYVTNSDAGYKQAILTYGGDQLADPVVKVSDGVTYGTRVIIPLQRSADDPNTVKVLAHELQHVLVNQNGGESVPSWVHEGLAWQTGLDAEFAVQPQVMRQQIDMQIRDYVLGVLQGGSYKPLISGYDAALDALGTSGGYNVELQDYLAYQYLVRQYGQEKFYIYLQKVAQGDASPFVDAFGVTPQSFEQSFRAYLNSELAQTSKGTEVTFKVDAGFQGDLRVLAPGTSKQKEFRLLVRPGGTYTVDIYKDGRIEGVNNEPSEYTATAEEKVAYIDIGTKAPVTDHGLITQAGGFAFYDSFGRFYLDSAWIDPVSGETAYPDTQKVLGIEVLNVKTI